MKTGKKVNQLSFFQSGHGTPMGNWDKVLEEVSELAPLDYLCRPGFGESEPDGEMPTIKNVSDNLVQILNLIYRQFIC